MEIKPKELKSKLSDAKLIDVRTKSEFETCHVREAINIPLAELTEQKVRDLIGNDNIITICQSGKRGQQAQRILGQLGFKNVINVQGGTSACQAEGLDLIENTSKISLERQVRITAGVLIVIGILLALLVNMAFLSISAFIGLGLIFSGITNTCGMGRFLLLMPWNK